MRIPCLKKKGLKLFVPTADQRILLGKDTFLRTHYPAKLRRYRADTSFETWVEQDLLVALKDSRTIIGNKVYIIYGSAGSGKSEVIRWLELNLESKKDQRHVFRISRTELDPVLIMKKLLSQMSGEELEKDILINWEALKKKPVTLANHLVWHALSMMLDTDDQIIPISYKLRPLIEQNLRNNFMEVGNRLELESKGIELVSLEELEKIVRDCAIPINLDYEQLRRHLVKQLEKEVLGGYSFVDTLREVGSKVESVTGSRPVLLVDDLVQSMNIYASDLLDFFTTFEEGNWDIVIGLTPASFESSKRGRELLNRINFLDTFDDRLIKLWLTDEVGQESYLINHKNVTEYLLQYLLEFKSLNGFICDQNCPHFNKCRIIHWGHDEDIGLTPLNQYLSRRIFASLFKGKGQARQLIVTVGEFLEALINGQEYEFLSEKVRREKSVDYGIPEVRVFIESLIPFDSPDQLTIPGELLRFGGFNKAKSITINISHLVNTPSNEIIEEMPKNVLEWPEITAIRDWLEGKEVNKELLRRFRLSVSNFLKGFTIKPGIVRQHTSRSSCQIRIERSIEGSKIPLTIEGIDQFEGVPIKRSLGHQAFKILRLFEHGGASGLNDLNELLSDEEVRNMFAKVNSFNHSWIVRFERELGIEANELAYLLYIFAFNVSSIDVYPKLIGRYYQAEVLKNLPGTMENALELSFIEVKFIKEFFNDWFELRENLYDAFELRALRERYPDIWSVLYRLNSITCPELSDEFMVGNVTMPHILRSILSCIKFYCDLIDNKTYKDDYIKVNKNITLASDLDFSIQNTLKVKLCTIQEHYFEMGKTLPLPNLPSPEEELDWLTMVTNMKRGYPYCLSALVNVIQQPVYCWVSGIQTILENVKADYLRLQKLLLVDIKARVQIINNDIDTSLTALELSDLNVVGLVNLAYDLCEKILLTQKKLDFIHDTNTYLSEMDLYEIRDFLKFMECVKEQLLLQDEKKLKLEKRYLFAAKYIKILDALAAGRDLPIDSLDIVREANVYLNSSDIKKVRNEICDLICSRIKSQQLLNLSTEVVSIGNSLIVQLMELKEEGRLDYLSIKNRLKEYNVIWAEEKQKIKLNIGTHYSDGLTVFMGELISGKVVKSTLDILNFELLGEATSKIPKLASVIDCTFVIRNQ